MRFEEHTELTPFTAAQEHLFWTLAQETARNELAALDKAVTNEEVFYALSTAAMAAWNLEKFELAQGLAEKTLLIAPTYANDWNFGNAVNICHNVLGLVALHRGQTEEAVSHLCKAGQSPGSPQLNTFGPSMQLARALAKLGRFDAALTYLDQCRVFWASGTVWLNLWEKKLRASEVPNFFCAGHR
jgi:Flp pilus assembly protein TadD